MLIINNSELSTWSVDHIKWIRQGKTMWVEKGGIYQSITEVPAKRLRPTWHSDHLADRIYMMTQEEATKVNGLLAKARELEALAKQLRDESKTLLKNKL